MWLKSNGIQIPQPAGSFLRHLMVKLTIEYRNLTKNKGWILSTLKQVHNHTHRHEYTHTHTHTNVRNLYSCSASTTLLNKEQKP